MSVDRAIRVLTVDDHPRLWEGIARSRSMVPFQSRRLLTRFESYMRSQGFTADYGALAYFPSAMRNAIVDAGSGMKLLRVTYDGYPLALG